MARRKNGGSPEPAPVTDAEITEALASGDDDKIIETAKRQAAADAALLAALEARDGTPAAEEPRQTIGDQFLEIAALVATARKSTRLDEATLVKLWELNLMWVLNNRQQPQSQFPAFEYGDESGSGDEGGEDLPVPTEVLGADAPSEE